MDAALDRLTVARMIDHTQLAPSTTDEVVAGLCREAAELGVAAVCVSPSRLPVPDGILPPEIAVAAVVGFPSGAHRSEVKAREAELAVADGATEIDMVIELGLARDRRWDLVEADIRQVREAVAGAAVLKVIIESAALDAMDDAGIEDACRTAEAAGADFVKTSTGFHPAGGATVEAVARMRGAVGSRLGVKASGGIRDWATAVAMVEAGASRLGCSATEDILAGAPQ